MITRCNHKQRRGGLIGSCGDGSYLLALGKGRGAVGLVLVRRLPLLEDGLWDRDRVEDSAVSRSVMRSSGKK